MKTRSVAAILGIGLTLLVLAGCTANHNPSPDLPVQLGHHAGFLSGLWHGFISPITFIVSLFNSNVGVYEIYNNGHWYDFGFLLGASAVFGSSARSAARKKRR